MFILNNGNSVWTNLVVIGMMWVILSFAAAMVWILVVAINLYVKAVRSERASDQAIKAYFAEVEEIRNDFI